MNKPLSEYFSLNRRYFRSINLERDLDKMNALVGYIATERSIDAIKRILAGLTGDYNHHAWTLTSVYGTGKSAFAHFLTSLCAPKSSEVYETALEIASKFWSVDSSEYIALQEKIPNQGLFRAVATAVREPLSNTIVRALERGTKTFWSPQEQNKLNIARQLLDFSIQVANGETIDSREIPKLIKEICKAADVPILLIIDELGKNLEFAVQNQDREDLYLLQQLVELPKNKDYQIYIVGLLHQVFADYGEKLASVQRNEWAKIQGRFEDIPFKDSPTQMMGLIGQAIDQTNAENFSCAISNQAQEWLEYLPTEVQNDYTHEVIAKTYPLHPITALALPILCTRYAQNDRSLFTFLTSTEPYSFSNFLKESIVKDNILPTLKLDRVYDYFIETVGSGLASRPNLQRWIEIETLISDANHLDNDCLQVLKTIGILNLVTTTGLLRATRKLVILAMCENSADTQKNKWEQVINNLLKRNIITHRQQLDELRIWQGSDFNVDVELTNYLEKERSPLVNLLSTICPLTPVVAQRHSYKTGTLRYFEQCYVDGLKDLTKISCSIKDCDGLVCYWVDEVEPRNVPSTTIDGKPLVILSPNKLDILRVAAREFAALKKIQTTAPELKTDGVARTEIRYRLMKAELLLNEALSQTFNIAAHQNPYWVLGKQEIINHITDFNAKLSDICDEVYNQSLILWNELINRRELTSQGTKARRELIEAMLVNQSKERLGLQGYGPEVSMYYSVLNETGIHRQGAEETLLSGSFSLKQVSVEEWGFGFYPAFHNCGVIKIWYAIDNFCLQAKQKPQTLDKLYQLLEAPPYGVKQGVIPVLLAAVLLYHLDDVGVYKDGSFIPILGSEHFELLVKDPSRFAVKYFEVIGLRSQVFKELESVLRKKGAPVTMGVRNITLLMVVKPLFQFVKKLPLYTSKTKRLGTEALKVLQVLQKEQEPDELLFKSLPEACGLSPIVAEQEDDGSIARTLRKKLVSALHEIQTAYDQLLTECNILLHNAFAVRSSGGKLREDLRVRASYLTGQTLESRLRSFVKAAADETTTDSEWVEALVMIIADKPAEAWTDEDVTNFEVQLADMARRFKNIESLQKNPQISMTVGLEARKITVTRPDGQETNSLIWFDNVNKLKVDGLVEKILAILSEEDNPQLHQTVVAKLTERVLGSIVSDNAFLIQDKSQKQEHGQKTS